MSQDIIHLLPDLVANQIAAGEVIQRPASAVKELLENAIDAGATSIQVIVKDSGKTLLQVVDDGSGMSFHDARLCFERHATSKITTTDDLFCLRTKGFRGEALPSIAAIAHVELKTKKNEDETGTLVTVEGSTITEHSPVATQDGTSISIKNLFYNVPARRNFLKSDAVEFGHIEEEFFRIALIHIDIAFTLSHNGKIIYQLQPSNFKQRIINIFGTHIKDKLFPVEQITDIIKISGFIAKPEYSKKQKAEQYLFINQRYVRHSLLNHAIKTAYTDLIPSGNKPAYFIHIELDPATIDINISPTKVEVKLQDERLVFGFLNSCVKKSLGQLSLIPRLDFEYERGLDVDVANFPSDKIPKIPSTGVDPNYNPFEKKSSTSQHFQHNKEKRYNMSGWEDFLKNLKIETTSQPQTVQTVGIDIKEQKDEIVDTENLASTYFIIGDNYLIIKLNNQLKIIHIKNGIERILYESYLQALENQPVAVQQSLFPETITLSTNQAEILVELKDELLKLGYEIEVIDKTRFAVNGTPNNDETTDLQLLIEGFIDSYKANVFLYRSERIKNIAHSLARQKRSTFKSLTKDEEVHHFIQQLLQCEVSYLSPSGKKIFHDLSVEEIEAFFNL